MVLSASDILAAQDHQIREVDVPEWGGKVCIRTISGSDRDKFEAQTFRQGKPDYTNLRARYLALVLCDDKGNLLFTEKQVGDLGKKAAGVLDRLFTEAASMNAMSKDDVDELMGNSEGGQSGDSTSA